ncbi:hypothetical protein PAAG_11392 [Paracoccidioides lutzii Pb01]|uniref:Uncharacterized protein n=1 Tax=Paracoccidioides lutzii (strain ATCC MYA-826 / Pb01) TaxID=502779 RepID=A0A0A2VLT6_PARBA|nr:hypothetical protein PAAG_11392 [Paracoccidioides lutzii Pb01]KGQ01819.1 hypothetical protein PAAG_11392 [Paracoccidioides lutzii Pb01]
MPTVTAITSIAMDHVKLLGPTIENIACPQRRNLQIRKRSLFNPPGAGSHGGVLSTICRTGPCNPDQCDCLETKTPENKLLPSACSRSLWLDRKAPDGQNISKHGISHGIEQFSWPGRYQHIRVSFAMAELRELLTWHLQVPDWPESTNLSFLHMRTSLWQNAFFGGPTVNQEMFRTTGLSLYSYKHRLDWGRPGIDWHNPVSRLRNFRYQSSVSPMHFLGWIWHSKPNGDTLLLIP